MTKVVHLTSVHQVLEPRILFKQCKSLAEAGYEVVLVVPAEQDQIIEGVQIRAVPKPTSRFIRFTCTIWQVYRKGLRENSPVYHFHDPELIGAGLLLKMKGKTVIYDVHEDYITSILLKRYLPSWTRRLLAMVFNRFELLFTKPFQIILAEKYYARRFPKGVIVLNYPIKKLIQGSSVVSNNPLTQKRLLYTGVITESRGALIHAGLVNLLDVDIYFVGRCSPGLAEKMRQVAGDAKNRIHIEGEQSGVPYERILDYYREGGWVVGLAIFPPNPHYSEKELTKFFEYMSVGLPVICSDFPVWRKLMNDTGAGICVNPTDSDSILRGIYFLLDNPVQARKMGENGQKAIRKTYNWENEARKLLAIYSQLEISKKVTDH